MTERQRTAGLAEQIELARKSIEQWPDWLRSSAHFSGTNHLEYGASASDDQPAHDASGHCEPGAA